jgi:acetolactate synthase-1/3 small subunit
MSTQRIHHILTLRVENRSGVLARVAGLFSRRGYNIYSLTVAPTSDPRFSQITLTTDVDTAPLDQIVAQIDKLINVVSITHLEQTSALERELLLATIPAHPDQRSQIIELVTVFRGEIVSVASNNLTVMVAGTPEALDSFEQLIAPYQPLELQRSGRVALPRPPS